MQITHNHVNYFYYDVHNDIAVQILQISVDTVEPQLSRLTGTRQSSPDNRRSKNY